MRTTLPVFVLLAAACGGAPDGISDPPADAGDGDGDIDAAVPEIRCMGLAAQPLDAAWTVRSGDTDRVADIHVPESYDPSRPTPVVLNFHGFGSNPGQQAFFSEMNDKSDLEGFIAVHASGLGVLASWNGGACCGTAANDDVDDVAFVRDLLDEMARRLCVDPRRVFATGLSNGGFMSHRLACESSERIAAIAPVAGVIGIDTCVPGRAVPVMHFHGTADALVPYGGGGLSGFKSVAETTAEWMARNSCGAATTSYQVGDTLCETASCAEGAEVTLCTITDGGHTWPGGIPIPGFGKTTMDIVATDAMWEFFVAHPLP